MKPDRTVLLSLAFFAVGFAVTWARPKPQPAWPVAMLLWAIYTLAGLRALVLWFQTFADACQPGGGKPPRSGWIVAHFLFGAFASYPYYYLQRIRARSDDCAGDGVGRALSAP